MHVGIDISVLRIAQAGMLRYHHNLVEHLVDKSSIHAFTLVDVLPLNPGLPTRSQLRAFDEQHVRIVRVTGLNRSYLSQCRGLRSGRLHTAAVRVDTAFNRVWDIAATGMVGVQLRNALRNSDVFHGSDQFFYKPPRGAAVLTYADLSTHAHPEFHIADNTALHSAKDAFARQRADHIIAISASTKAELTKYLEIPPEKISVVHLAADASFRPLTPTETTTTLARYGLKAGNYLLSVGTLEPRKNYLRLLNAYARLRTQRPVTPPLVIAGGRGWLYNEIVALAESHELASHVRLLGHVADEELPALISSAAAFVYPSLYEGFGLPVLEALACGAPVIAANTTSIPEVLGDAGLLVNPLDEEAITAALGDVLDDPALASHLRAAGPTRAATFSWERMARETLQVYERVCGQKRSSI